MCEIMIESPRTATSNAGGVGKIAFSDRSRSLPLRRLTAKNLCSSATVVCIHVDDALAEERDAINNIGGSQSWLITASLVDINKVGCVEVC